MPVAKKSSAEKNNIPINTVQDKVHLEKQLPYSPNDNTGPTVELYFHELSSDDTFAQKLLHYLTAFFATLLFVATLPSFSIIIRLFSGGPIFNKTKVPGRRGQVFTRYRYSTQFTDTEKEDFLFGRLLHKTGLEKLPSIINVWKGEMKMFGPESYPEKWCNKWNRELSDYYKRFAVRPGFFTVSTPIQDPKNINQVANSLKKELRYVVNPTTKKDFQVLLGNN